MTVPFVGRAAVESEDGMNITWPCGCAAATSVVHRADGTSGNEMLVRACIAEHDRPLETFIQWTVVALALAGRTSMPDFAVVYPENN